LKFPQAICKTSC